MSDLSPATLAAIHARAAALRDQMVDMLRHGVGIPSVNPSRPGGSGEGAFQTFIARELRDLGARLDIWEPDGPALAERYGATLQSSTCDFRGRPNVVGTIGPANGDPLNVHLILNSHADTVAADVAHWTHDPFAGKVEEGRLYGLGSSDAKGSLLTYLGALKVLHAAGIRLRHSVALCSVVDEEAGGGGTLACIERGYRATGALVGEPTALAVCPGSRGAFGIALTITGRGAHLGVAYNGVNAIDLAVRYVEAFHELGRQLDREYRHPLWQSLPVGHVFSVTQMSSLPTPGSVPSQCEVRFSTGFMAGESREGILARVESVFGRVTRANSWLNEHPPNMSLTSPFIDAAATSMEHPLVIDLLAAAEDLKVDVPPVHALSAGTDGRFLNNEGGIGTVNFGPGQMALGHGPDEYIDLEEFQRAIELVAVAVARYCEVENSGAPADIDV